jgi:peptidoglycan/LPS O-acetylase OafA/YrhL
MAKKLFRPVIRTSSLTYRPELDGLRALAIAGVVTAHLGLFGYGPYGVDFFFVLSGFLITDVLLKLRDGDRSLRTFWIGRIARLTPILIINVVIGSILSYLFLRSTFHLSQPLSALFYVKNFFIASPLNHDVWAPTWTLAAEEQFYLVWPLVIFFLAKRMRLATFISIVVIYFLAIHGILDLMRNFYGHLNPEGVLSDGFAGKVVQVVIRPSEILLGALITILRKIPGPPIVLCFIGVNVAGIFYGLNYATQTALLSGLILSLLELNIWPGNILRRVLSLKPLVLIGILSYSIYLWHSLILEVVFSQFERSGISKLTIVALTLLASYVSYVYLELPLQKIIKHRALGWTKK